VGLKTDIYNAKYETAKILTPDLDDAINDSEHPKHQAALKTIEAFNKESELMTTAIKNLLNHEDFILRVTNLKASVKLHQFSVTKNISADISPTVGYTPYPGGAPSPVPAPLINGMRGVSIPALQFREDGGLHGGFLNTYGHAYIGEQDDIPISDTAVSAEDNNFTEVRYVKKDNDDNKDYWS